MEVELNGKAAPSEVLKELCRGREMAKEHIFCKEKVNPNIAILINGRSVNHLKGLKTRVTNEDEIVILQTAAGR